MHETISTRQSLQPISNKKQVKYAFVPVPEYIERDIADAKLEKLWRIVLRSLRRGVAELPLRFLAHSMKKSIRTVQRYIRALVRLGKLIVTERKVAHNRNLANIFTIPELGRGVGDKIVVEKKGEILKTNTPATGRGSRLRQFWEARFAQDRKDSAWKRKQFEERARNWANLAKWSLEKTCERNRLAMLATVGANTYTGPTMSEEEAEEVRKRIEAKTEEAKKRLWYADPAAWRR